MPGAAEQDSLFDLLRWVILRLVRLGTATYERAIRSRATGARHRHRRICKSSLQWPSTEGARMGHDHKTDAIFFRFVLRRVSETKIKTF